MTLVTIGIPTYNVGRFINQTIKSILAQSYINFELIITDDGSTDNTIEEVKKFNDPRIKLIVDGENRGISYRLNQQINLAKGKYFVRMDGDDLMFPDRVEKEVAYLERHPDVDVVGGKAIVIGDNNEILGFRESGGRYFKKSDVFFATRFIHPSIAGKTEWFQKWKYREEMAGCEDMDLWIRSFDYSTFADCPEPIIFYRDPLRFKLRTYLYRQKKVVKCIWQLRDEMPSPKILVRCILKSFIASCFSVFLSIIGRDKQMISRRNKQLEHDEFKKYQRILAEL